MIIQSDHATKGRSFRTTFNPCVSVDYGQVVVGDTQSQETLLTVHLPVAFPQHELDRLAVELLQAQYLDESVVVVKIADLLAPKKNRRVDPETVDRLQDMTDFCAKTWKGVSVIDFLAAKEDGAVEVKLQGIGEHSPFSDQKPTQTFVSLFVDQKANRAFLVNNSTPERCFALLPKKAKFALCLRADILWARATPGETGSSMSPAHIWERLAPGFRIRAHETSTIDIEWSSDKGFCEIKFLPE
jgi:hypothetical protein